MIGVPWLTAEQAVDVDGGMNEDCGTRVRLE